MVNVIVMVEQCFLGLKSRCFCSQSMWWLCCKSDTYWREGFYGFCANLNTGFCRWSNLFEYLRAAGYLKRLEIGKVSAFLEKNSLFSWLFLQNTLPLQRKKEKSGHWRCLYPSNSGEQASFLSVQKIGALAHLARAFDWQSRGDEFESRMLHEREVNRPFFFCCPLNFLFPHASTDIKQKRQVLITCHFAT